MAADSTLKAGAAGGLEPLVLLHRHPPHWSPADAPVLRLSLTAHDRSRLRGLRHSLCGRPLLLQLPRQQPLQPGEWLLGAETADPPVRVEAAPEAVMVVRAEQPLALLQAAYHLGNRHVALQVEAHRLILLADPVLANLLHHRGLEVEHGWAPFLPEGGAYGHSHG